MWRRRIFDCSVVRLRPSRAAAPVGPAMTPCDSLNARRIASRSASFNVAGGFDAGDAAARRALGWVSSSASASVDPAVRITARSMTFCNSRMLPGQLHPLSASITVPGIVGTGRPMRRAH